LSCDTLEQSEESEKMPENTSVAALAFGPKHVFVVVSHSKITSSVDEALKRFN
jgi:hypothetical protein